MAGEGAGESKLPRRSSGLGRAFSMEPMKSMGLGFLSPRDGLAAAGGSRLLSGVSAGVSGVSSHTGRTLKRFYRGVYNAFKREKGSCQMAVFNPEKQAAQKREWLENRSQQEKRQGWPEHCFEHLVIVGLPASSGIDSMAGDVRREKGRKKTGSGASQGLSDWYLPLDKLAHHAPPCPSYSPEVLYQFPEGKPLHMSAEQLASFCFPHGVTPSLLNRTPSMSALNEVIYGQQHLVKNDRSFVFMQKGGDDLPMFGVCYYVPQMVQTPPALGKDGFAGPKDPMSKNLLAANRCYCLLSRYPFFNLHFQVLNVILGFERLETITDFMEWVSAHPPRPSLSCRLGFNSINSVHRPSPSPSPEPPWSNASMPTGKAGHRTTSSSPSLLPLMEKMASPGPSGLVPGRRLRDDGGLKGFPGKEHAYELGRRSLGAERCRRSVGRISAEFGAAVGKQRPPAAPTAGADVLDSFSSMPMQGWGGHESVASKSPSCGGGASSVDTPAPSGLGRMRSPRGSDTDMQSPMVSKRSGAMQLEGRDGGQGEDASLGPYPSPRSFCDQGNDDLGPSGAEYPFGTGSQNAGACMYRDCTVTPDVDSGASSSMGHWHEYHKRAQLDRLVTHVRSVSGQSLHGFEDEVGSQGPSASEAASQLSELPGQGAFSGQDSAFHTPLAFTSSMPSRVYDLVLSQQQAMGSNCDLYLGTGAALNPPWRNPSAEEFAAAASHSGLRHSKEVEPEQGHTSTSRRVLSEYYAVPVPLPGETFVFIPDGLQPIEYTRPKVKALGRCNSHLEGDDEDGTASVLSSQIELIDAETAANLRLWSVATLCKSLSLDNVLCLVAALLQEKQVAFFSPNIGILTAAVLSVIPILRPYVWQSLIMPVVPARLLDLLDAPVPFAVGLQHKTAEVVQRSADLVRVNLYKDGVKNAPPASSLPGFRRLHASLAPLHRRLQDFRGHSRRPVHYVGREEEAAAEGFLRVMGTYLQGLCENIQEHTITEVGPTGRVSLLVEDSLVESFAQKDWPFMKTVVQTQLFSSYVDSVIS